MSNSATIVPSELNRTAEALIPKTGCIEYEPVQKLIKINCQPVTLTDIYNSLNNPSILGKESDTDGSSSRIVHKSIWVLDAGIVVEKAGGLVIDSNDTSWLKITSSPTLQLKNESGNKSNVKNITSENKSNVKNQSFVEETLDVNASNNKNIDSKNQTDVIIVSKHNGDNPNGIHVHGYLKIDSVKITSWDPEKNDVIRFGFGKRPGEEHTKSDYDTAEPRAFIRVSKDATGTTNITNSELAYLGYSCSRCAGLSYYGGEGSLISNNDIHHLLKGFYSKNAGHLTIDRNKFHHNYLYGIDPHTGTHDLVITNNRVYLNNASGIICSKDCYNLIIEGNEVYNNSGAARGIAFSINTTKSVAKNNYIHDQSRCISFNRGSDNNDVYNNTISNCKTGVSISNAGNNSIHDNEIKGAKTAVLIMNPDNKIYDNKIFQSKNGIVFEVIPSNHSKEINNIDTSKGYDEQNNHLASVAGNNSIVDTEFPTLLK